MHFDAVPIWAIFAATMTVVIAAIEGGYRLGQARYRRSAGEKESPVSAIAGSNLGLAAFLLAFTFRHSRRHAGASCRRTENLKRFS